MITLVAREILKYHQMGVILNIMNFSWLLVALSTIMFLMCSGIYYMMIHMYIVEMLSNLDLHHIHTHMNAQIGKWNIVVLNPSPNAFAVHQ